MIYLSLKGQLGNQLFQYATVKSFCLEKGIKLYFGGKRNGLFDFELPDLGIDQYVFKTLSKFNFFDGFIKNQLKSSFTPSYDAYIPSVIGEIYDPNFFKTEDNTFACGWFQSEKYFKHNREQIIKWFTPKPHFRQMIDKIESSLKTQRDNRVCIHIRRGDYAVVDAGLGNGKDGWQLPESYYHDAIRSIHHEKLLYIIISDDPDYAEKCLGYLSNKIVMRNNPGIVDMFLLTLCKYNIIANSSFSWWGAWINQIDQKMIIAPKYFVGWHKKVWYPDSIEVPGWTYLEIR